MDSIWPQLRGRHVIGTQRARTAIALALRMLNITKGDEMLVPSYNCGTEVDAIAQCGVRTRGYRVSESLEIDVADLMGRRTANTRGVYVIHYFGWEQQLQQLRNWCDNTGLVLIEDCALALFSGGPDGLVGRIGDAAVFSLSKTFGSAYGGLLSLRKTGNELPSLKASSLRVPIAEIRRSIRVAALRYADKIGLYAKLHRVRKLLRRRLPNQSCLSLWPPMPVGYCFNKARDENKGLSPLFGGLINTESKELVSRRRRNYKKLTELLVDVQSLKLVFAELPDGVCPLSFPLRSTKRDLHVAKLQARGIAALPWWAGFHRSGVNWPEFPEACALKRDLLTLPIHHQLSDEQIRYIALTAADVFRKS